MAVLAHLLSLSFVSGTLDGIPECAVHCYGQHVGNCQITDVACRCRDPEVIAVTSKCILNSCARDDVESAERTTKAICEAEGASLIVPPMSELLNASTSSPATASAPTASQTAPAQPNGDAATRNTNGAFPQSVNVVAGVVAFGLVVLAI